MASFDAPGEFAIKADGISKKFLLGRRSNSLKDRLTGFNAPNREEFWAFQDISITVPKGSMLGVIGRNGSGKSTFLRTLCGVYRPTIGEVLVRGRITALLELGAGFHAEFTGKENIYMNGAVVGLDRDYMDSVMDDIIAMADIGSFIDAPIETYSSGMRARLGFAVSVQMQPEILLADEITAVGDIAFKEHGVRRMNELREGGATIVQVSHGMKMLAENCDQVLWIHHGRARRIGDPKEVIEEYQEVANVDKSGRMIGGGEPGAQDPRTTPPKKTQNKKNKGNKPNKPNKRAKARQQKQARTEKLIAVTETLAADDLNPTWFNNVEFAGADGGDLVVGSPARFSLDFNPTEDLVEPSIHIRVLAAGGNPTGFGYDSGLLEAGALDAPIDVSVEALGLPSGRFNLRIDLLSASTVVATHHTSVHVRPRPTTDGEFTPMPARWAVASKTTSG